MTENVKNQIIELIEEVCDNGFGTIEIRINDGKPTFIRKSEDLRIND